MISTLAFTVLGLAAASEPEMSDEKAWEKRFQDTDRLRKTWGVPPLTARERFAMILGQSAPRDTHVIQVVHVIDQIGWCPEPRYPERYDILIWQFLGTKNEGEPLWKDAGRYKWSSKDSNEGEKTAKHLSDILYIPFSEENPKNSIGIPKFREG